MRVSGFLVRVSPWAPSWQRTGRVSGALLDHDAQDGGPMRIAGTVKIDGSPATPVARRVRLFHRLSGRLVRETWSAADGTFAFERIAAGQYLVIADDYTGTYEAEAADRVQAEP